MSLYEFNQGMTSEDVRRRREAGISGANPALVQLEERRAKENAERSAEAHRKQKEGRKVWLAMDIEVIRANMKNYPGFKSHFRQVILQKQRELEMLEQDGKSHGEHTAHIEISTPTIIRSR